MGSRRKMRPEDRKCPKCGAHEAEAVKFEEDWHVVCQQCGYVAQGFTNSAGDWELWNDTRRGGGLIRGTCDDAR